MGFLLQKLQDQHTKFSSFKLVSFYNAAVCHYLLGKLRNFPTSKFKDIGFSMAFGVAYPAKISANQSMLLPVLFFDLFFHSFILHSIVRSIM